MGRGHWGPKPLHLTYLVGFVNRGGTLGPEAVAEGGVPTAVVVATLVSLPQCALVGAAGSLSRGKDKTVMNENRNNACISFIIIKNSEIKKHLCGK